MCGAKHDEAAIGERRPEIVVERHVPVDRLARQPVAAVLDYDHRAPLAGGDPLGYHDHAPREHVGPDVEDDVPGRPSVRLADLARPGVERHVRRVERADAVPAEALAIGTRAFDELCRGHVGRDFSVFHFSPCQLGQDAEEKRSIANMLGRPHQSLDVPLHFEHRPGVARARIESLPAVRKRARRTRRQGKAQPFRKLAERLRRYRRDRPIAVAGDESGCGEPRSPGGNAIELGANRRPGRRLPGALAAGERWNLGVLDHQVAGQDERGDLGIAEPFEQAPDVAIDRLFPHPPASIEVAAHERAIDTRVDGRGIEGHQTAFGIADDADLRRLAAAGAEAVDRGEHFLDFEADRVPAHVEGLPVDRLPPGLLTLTKLRIGGLDQLPPDQRRNDQFAAALGQETSELALRRQPGGEAKNLFGSLPGIRHGHERRLARARSDWLARGGGLDEQTFGRHPSSTGQRTWNTR